MLWVVLCGKVPKAPVQYRRDHLEPGMAVRAEWSLSTSAPVFGDIVGKPVFNSAQA